MNVINTNCLSVEASCVWFVSNCQTANLSEQQQCLYVVSLAGAPECQGTACRHFLPPPACQQPSGLPPDSAKWRLLLSWSPPGHAACNMTDTVDGCNSPCSSTCMAPSSCTGVSCGKYQNSVSLHFDVLKQRLYMTEQP